MQGTEPKLSANQERAIVALLTEPTIAAAAKKAGVNEATIWRWQQQKGFQTAYWQARRTAMGSAVASLQRLAGHVVACLATVMTDRTAPAGSRVSAAKIVLDSAMQGIEIYELAEGLQSLEDLLAEAREDGKAIAQWPTSKAA